MDTEILNQFRKITGILLRSKALISLSVIIAMASGLAFYLKQPKLYQSSALLSYQQQKVNPAAMSPDSDEKLRDIVSTLSQIVLSRSNLEKIIVQERLYGAELERLPMADVVLLMRNKIKITPSRQGDTFQVSFTDKEPARVARVTNALAAKFIEENMRYRAERASETSIYTADELNMAKEALDQREELMRDYKMKNYNEMPDQQASNVNRLIALQTQYQNAQASIQDLERTRLLLQEQITVRKQLIERAVAQSVASGHAALVETDRQRLNRYQAELQMMLGRYTEQHPSVKALQRRISQLEETLQEQTAASPGGEEAGNGERFDKDLFGLELQLRSVGLNIEKLNNEKDEIQKLIKQYEKWVEQAPLREAEWSSLTREYAQLKLRYDFLVSQNLQARSALNLERNQKGSQFKIEDPALPSSKPTEPDFAKTMFFAFGIGFGLAGAIILLLEMFDTSFRNPRDFDDIVKTHLDVDMICAIPHLPLKREIIKKRVITTLGSCCIFAMASGLAGAFVYFYRNGQIVL